MSENPSTTTGGNGSDLIDRTADGHELTDEERGDALAYFMGDAPRPNEGTPIPLELDFGTPERPNHKRVTCRPLEWEELDRADARAEVKNAAGIRTGSNEFVRASWILAQAMVEPKLGPALEKRNRDGAKLPDAAALLRDVFKFAPGVLMHAADLVEKRSRLAMADDQAAREVEAGKDSS